MSLGLGDAGSSCGDSKYQQIDDLEPLVNPDLEWKLCLTDIRSDNWSRQFEACNTLRKVLKYHWRDLLTKGGKIDKQSLETFHEICQQLTKLVESLRSSVAKISMITLYEMFETLPK